MITCQRFVQTRRYCSRLSAKLQPSSKVHYCWPEWQDVGSARRTLAIDKSTQCASQQQWLVYFKLEIGEYIFLLAPQCPICTKLCRDFNSLPVNCFNAFTLVPILCKDISWRKAAPSDQMVDQMMLPRCSLSPNIGSIMETLRAVGHDIRLDNWLLWVFFISVTILNR